MVARASTSDHATAFGTMRVGRGYPSFSLLLASFVGADVVDRKKR